MANIATAIASRKWQMVKRAVYQGRVVQKSTTFGTPIVGATVSAPNWEFTLMRTFRVLLGASELFASLGGGGCAIGWSRSPTVVLKVCRLR